MERGNTSMELDRKRLRDFLKFIEDDLENVRRVADFCEERGIDAEFIVHGKAETVAESAENTGVPEEEIVKTLVFLADGEPVAVMCPGHTSVDEDKLAGELDVEEVEMASPERVEEATGYVVGGVSPFDLDIPVVMDREILDHEQVKPAAGSRVVGLKVDPAELEELADTVADVSR